MAVQGLIPARMSKHGYHTLTLSPQHQAHTLFQVVSHPYKSFKIQLWRLSNWKKQPLVTTMKPLKNNLANLSPPLLEQLSP